jgi:hypothetical protein
VSGDPTSGHSENVSPAKHMVHLPAPTAWPVVLALGATLLLAGIVMTAAVSVVGLLLMVCASVGWFRDVLPRERSHHVPVLTEVVEIKSSRTQVERLPVAESHRTFLPLERYTLSAGVRGGIAGGIAMIAPATLYGLLRYRSIWYAPDLLAAIAIPGWDAKSTAFLSAFHVEGVFVAVGVHALASILVGLLYGAVLPMFPQKPILTAGFLAPIFWTGMLYGTLEVVSPLLNQRIDWLWFVVSQIAFGLVAGFVVNLHHRVRTHQFQSLPFSLRAGILSPGIDEEANGQDGSR